MKPRPRRLLQGVGAAVLLVALIAALVAWLNVRGEAPVEEGADGIAAAASPALLERGAYLARAGNCVGCHTANGGAPFAGGRGVETPFGVVFASNITPDAATGIGRWSADAFWRALHHGRSKDGRLLYPAFPYPSFTHVTREDADALYAHLMRSVPPVPRPNTPHALRFPYGTQPALAVWRALFFAPGTFTPSPQQGAEWNRGKYLVQGLGHCAACHSGRNALGAASLHTEFAGGPMPDASWYAPSLATPDEAGVQGWPRQDVVRLLKDGVSSRASVTGPMAEVVYTSTQYLSEPDLDAMARFLASIPVKHRAAASAPRADEAVLTRGGKLYEQHCAGCHGERGQGVSGIYPALAGNRAVTLASPNNLLQTIRHGGFAPATAGNPRPFGMPPFVQTLSNDEAAAVITFLRQSWGHEASAVSPSDVLRVK